MCGWVCAVGAVIGLIRYNCVPAGKGGRPLLVTIACTVIVGGCFAGASTAEPREWSTQTDVITYVGVIAEQDTIAVFMQGSHDRSYACNIEECGGLHVGDNVSFESGNSGVFYVSDGSMHMRRPTIIGYHYGDRLAASSSTPSSWRGFTMQDKVL